MKKTITFACAAVFAVACGVLDLDQETRQGQGGQTVSTGKPLSIRASITDTRTIITGNTEAFTQGDRISVYAWTGSADEVSENRIVDGVCNTMDGEGKWIPETEMRWEDESTPHYFLGIYPYRKVSSFTKDVFTVSPDDYNASNLMVATKLDGTLPGEGEVPLKFSHLMAQLRLQVQYKEEMEGGLSAPLVLVPAKEKAYVNYLKKEVEACGNIKIITQKLTGSNAGFYTYATMMVPQELGSIVVIVNGKEYRNDGSITLRPGESRLVNLVIRNDKEDTDDPGEIEVMSSSSVDDWTESEGEIEVNPNSPSKAIKAVDMGLSVKWADRNLGASSPAQYGTLYAWGETEAKSSYAWSNYKWCEGTSTSLTKYNANEENGVVDNKKTLDLDDDAAHVTLGGKWRMPTYAEVTELSRTQDNADYSWVLTYMDGNLGFKVTCKVNGNSIFLPIGTSEFYEGGFWSSSVQNLKSRQFNAYAMLYGYFSYSGEVVPNIADCITARNQGNPVRPVSD